MARAPVYIVDPQTLAKIVRAFSGASAPPDRVLACRMLIVPNASGFALREVVDGGEQHIDTYDTAAKAAYAAAAILGRPADEIVDQMDTGMVVAHVLSWWEPLVSAPRAKTICPECGGSGRYVGLSVVETCGTCGGSGSVEAA